MSDPLPTKRTLLLAGAPLALISLAQKKGADLTKKAKTVGQAKQESVQIRSIHQPVAL